MIQTGLVITLCVSAIWFFVKRFKKAFFEQQKSCDACAFGQSVHPEEQKN